MVFKILLGLALLSIADAKNWALLVAGSKTYENYRHQADVCHAYQLLVSKGFSKDRIITMAFDDIAFHESNPFPGQLFNSPGTPGVDVYNGCNIDYKGADVTASNFVNLLLGNNDGVIGGNGRTLDTLADDDLTIAYFDHGAPGLIQFPGGDTLHTSDFKKTLATMHHTNRYGRMVIYMEACQSGSMLDGLRTDLNIYGVTAVDSVANSLGTYCYSKSNVNGKALGLGANGGCQCLGDLFSVYWMRFVETGDGSHTLQSLFETVNDECSSFNSMDPYRGQEMNQQYGNLSMGQLTVGDFFHGDSRSDITMAAQFESPWVPPDMAYAVPRLAMHTQQFAYSEASAQPTRYGEAHWLALLQSTDNLQELLREQKQTQQIYWDLVFTLYPNATKHDQHMYDKRYAIWTSTQKPVNPECEHTVHDSLVNFCTSKADLTSSYALQFHQVVVNLCAEKDLKTQIIVNTGEFICKPRAQGNIIL